MSEVRNIRYWDVLLGHIAQGVTMLHQTKPSCIEVKFWEGDKCVLTTDLATALDYLANDTYWDEESDWSKADRATVGVI